MPEQKMTYQERVDEVANSYAVSYNSYMDFEAEYKTKESFLYEGRKAVAAQAEAIRWALTLPYMDHVISPEFVEKLLLEHGYIEPKPLFHCNNKGRHYSDPGYKPVCKKQCKECAEWYPVNGGYIEPKTEEDGK